MTVLLFRKDVWIDNIDGALLTKHLVYFHCAPTGAPPLDEALLARLIDAVEQVGF